MGVPRCAGLDPEPACQYWFSIDAHNRRLSYGKGEMRLATRLASCDLPPAADAAPDAYDWLMSVDTVEITGIATDHCVRATALDARRNGFATTVRLDLTAGVAAATVETALAN